jgi:uncharacterized protein YcfJ
MKTLIKTALTLAAVAIAAQAAAEVTFYDQENFQGEAFTAQRPLNNLRGADFNDRASSAVVVGQRWEVCDDVRFQGRCVVLRPGQYPSLSAIGLDNRISSVRAIAGNTRVDERRYAPMPVVAQVTFYENEGFGGRSFTTDTVVNNFQRSGFNDRASSVVVVGDARWEVCEDARFGGRCAVLRAGQYPSLAAMGLNNRISSVQVADRNARADDQRFPNAPQGAADFRRRNDERLFEANVTSVRAVVGPPEQRCWLERGQVQSQGNANNVPGAIVGALIGGILGHQVGGGTGKDIATAGGVVTGAVVGSRVGGNNQPQTQDVQRCENVPSQAQPQFWDVTYEFRGQEHRVQMTAPPGQTVTVNAQGEPRQNEPRR